MRTPLLAVLALSLAACGQSGTDTAQVVQAATRGVAEAGQQLAEKAAELSGLTPEEARSKVQELIDVATRELRAVRDSETARLIAQEIQRLLEQLGVFAARLGQKLNVASLQTTIDDMIQKFREDPRVTSTLKELQEKLNGLAR